jgi:hypothetical protein
VPAAGEEATAGQLAAGATDAESGGTVTAAVVVLPCTAPPHPASAADAARTATIARLREMTPPGERPLV